MSTNTTSSDKCPTCGAVWSGGIGRHNWLDRAPKAEAELQALRLELAETRRLLDEIRSSLES